MESNPSEMRELYPALLWVISLPLGWPGQGFI